MENIVCLSTFKDEKMMMKTLWLRLFLKMKRAKWITENQLNFTKRNRQWLSPRSVKGLRLLLLSGADRSASARRVGGTNCLPAHPLCLKRTGAARPFEKRSKTEDNLIFERSLNIFWTLLGLRDARTSLTRCSTIG
jgi:hypothetical protein